MNFVIGAALIGVSIAIDGWVGWVVFGLGALLLIFGGDE